MVSTANSRLFQATVCVDILYLQLNENPKTITVKICIARGQESSAQVGTMSYNILGGRLCIGSAPENGASPAADGLLPCPRLKLTCPREQLRPPRAPPGATAGPSGAGRAAPPPGPERSAAYRPPRQPERPAPAETTANRGCQVIPPPGPDRGRIGSLRRGPWVQSATVTAQQSAGHPAVDVRSFSTDKAPGLGQLAGH